MQYLISNVHTLRHELVTTCYLCLYLNRFVKIQKFHKCPK